MPRGTSIVDEANLQRRLWTPAELSRSADNIWLDANDLRTLTINSSGNVTEWRDKIGGSRNFTSSGSPPSYQASRLNSLPTIRFPTSTVLSTSPTISSTKSTTYTMVLMREATGNITPLIESGVSYAYLHYGDFWYWGNQAVSVPITSNVFYIHTCVATDTGSSRYQNGTLIGTSGSDNLNGFTALNSTFSSVAWQCAEVIFHNYIYTDRQRQNVEGYLAWRWRMQSSLPATHRFRNRPPLIGD